VRAGSRRAVAAPSSGPRAAQAGGGGGVIPEEFGALLARPDRAISPTCARARFIPEARRSGAYVTGAHSRSAPRNPVTHPTL
jgi:hypothetical protein